MQFLFHSHIICPQITFHNPSHHYQLKLQSVCLVTLEGMKFIYSAVICSLHSNKSRWFPHKGSGETVWRGGSGRRPLQSLLKWSRGWVCWPVSPGHPAAGLKPPLSLPPINRRAAPPAACLMLQLPLPSTFPQPFTFNPFFPSLSLQSSSLDHTSWAEVCYGG